MAAGTRPLTLGEILDRTVQLYRRNFLLLAGIAIPAAALIGVITGALLLFFTSRVFSIEQLGRTGQGAPVDSQLALEFGLVIGLFLLIGVPIILGVFAMAQAALNYAVTRINEGETATMRASYGYAFRHFWRHIGILFLQTLFAGVIPYCAFGALAVIFAILGALAAKSAGSNVLAPLFVVLIVIGVIALLAVCILIWLRLSLGYAASAAENLKAWPSLKRSNLLTKGTRGRIFVMILLVGVLTLVVSLAMTIPLDIILAFFTQKSSTPGEPPTRFLFLTQVVNVAIGFLVRIFVMPIYATSLVLFYTDQRTRLEGYDIEQLMAQAGWNELPPPPPSVPPPAVPLNQPGAPENTPFFSAQEDTEA